MGSLLSPPEGRKSGLWFPVLTLLSAGVVGGVGATSTAAGIGLVLGPILLAAVFASPTLRLAVVVSGALIVFQSPSDRIKYSYIGLAFISVLVSCVELYRHQDDVRRAFRPMLVAGVLMTSLIAMSSFNALTSGVTVDNWVRDMLAYLLCVTLPVVGLDASRQLSPRTLAGIFFVVGVASSFAFASDWLNRRGAVEGLGRVLLASATLPMLMLGYALVRAVTGPHRPRWTAVAVLIPVALLITGTRTYLVVFFALTVGALGSRAKGRVPPLLMLRFLAVSGSLTAALVYLLARDWLTNVGFVHGRVAVTLAALSGHVSRDQSFVARAQSYRLANATWHEHVWLGAGPGHLYPGGTFTMDTPLLVLAKFGLIGTVGIIVFMVCVCLSVARCQLAPDAFYTAGRSWAFALVALVPFGPWFEDKGTSLALALLVCATASVSYARREGERPLAALPRLPQVGDRDADALVRVADRRTVDQEFSVSDRLEAKST